MKSPHTCDAETPEHRFGDAFEAGPAKKPSKVTRDEDAQPADVLDVQPGGALTPMGYAKRR